MLPLITIQSALDIALKRSRKGPEGIKNPFPINCFELKHKIEKFGLIEKSWKIPLHHKIKGKNGKMILKEILKDYLPNGLITKSKAGFAIPIDNLLRTKLKFWVEEILQNSEKTNEIINYKNVKNRHR